MRSPSSTSAASISAAGSPVTVRSRVGAGGCGAAARARVLHLVRRLVHGEEPNPELFAILSRLSVKEIGEVDSVVAVLSALGYIDAAAAEGKTEREKIALVNASLRETHL